MAVEFRVLGEVAVLRDGRPVDVGHARQRCVLAVLLVELGRPVPTDELIDRVWADRPPYRARNALSAYVSRLRTLVAAPEVELARAGTGYALTADPASVDLHAFRLLAAQARAADRPADAAALADRALASWRGTPLGSVDTPWFAAVRTSLEAERLAVLLDRNDAALAAGRHADLLVELTDAVRAHPLDERLAGQLMLAQVRSGRQADALASFRAVRARLADELGVDPGAPLRAVHQRILTGDAATPTPSAPTVPAPRPEPAPEPEPATPALPRRATSFVGRRADLDRVTAALAAGSLVTLTGLGGVGKTRVALEVARHGGGAWFAELAPLEDGGPVSQAVATALHLQQRAGATIEQTVIEYLRDRELLLVLDNCEHVLAGAAGLAEQVLRHCPAVTVLATSREPLGVEGERIVPIDPLPPHDAATLFVDRARAARPGFDPEAEKPGAVVDLCRRLDGLPLGIELAAARMRAMNAAEVASRLADPSFVAGGSRATPTRHQSLAAAVAWSHRLLSDRERTLFDRLSVFAGGVDLDAAHAACAEPGDTEADTADLLTALVDKSMVTVDHAGDATWYRLLETMRRYGRERLGDDLDAARERHARAVLDLTERAAAGLVGPDEGQWVERLLRAWDDVRIAVGWAIARQDADLALRLVVGVPDVAYWCVGYELADWAQDAVRLPGAAGHPLAPAVLGAAARGAFCLGDFPRAVRLARETGVPEWVEGASRGSQPGDVLAIIDVYEGGGPDGHTHYARQVELARPSGDLTRLTWTLSQLSLSRTFLGATEAALRDAEECLAVARAAGGNPTGVALGLLSIGRALQDTDPATALAYLDESAATFASVRNRWFAAYAGMYAAATHVEHSDVPTATAALLPVLDAWEQLGERSQQWLTLLFSARLLIRLGADAEVVTLHHALVAAGQPALLGADRLAELDASLGAVASEAAARRGATADGPAAIAVVRSALRVRTPAPVA
ncbi:putative ATPase [Actinomycetospora succinea]|uniref:Putative ATPase n=1 Tax=Actinomycetospora succinea TaxID=663603 RepID=A0A4R6VSB6_9PSEU|nr:BTAD domain-containing putative transcriptional regulator [Actinomycetospora succinea]TDQ65507.1 putative ATPase [Actinomycetospora succinea]